MKWYGNNTVINPSPNNQLIFKNTDMKVELENVVLGHSPLTDTIFAGILNKDKRMWLKKVDVTNHFIDCVIKRCSRESC